MTAWLIIPRDPVIFRDGRPFTAAPGARATTLPFPFPSTVSGAVRTLAGLNKDTGYFDTNRVDDLQKKQVRGPLLAELAAKDQVKRLLVPAPADALILKQEGKPESARRLWLRPVRLPDNFKTNFRDFPYLVAPRKPTKAKTHRNTPAFWYWEDFEAWLLQPQDEQEIPNIRAWGLQELPRDHRVHVRLASETQTADPGGLFVTSGLEFVRLPAGENTPLSQATEYGLLLDTEAEPAFPIGFLGGERRIARWHASNTAFPSCPKALREQIIKHKACRLVLLTPALFEQGYFPTWVLTQAGVQAEIQAAAVRRYRTVSGWDHQQEKPKANRRLAPAGSVYYLKLQGDPDAIRTFVDAVWMQNISDDEQARRDGFGLAVLGTWSGEAVEMEVGDA